MLPVRPPRSTIFPYTTLFRSSLAIATTRLILLDGYAGEIINTFGNFVVGGNLVVGLVVFMILTIVQFIVITKGSEREIGRAHVCTPVTVKSRMPSSA